VVPSTQKLRVLQSKLLLFELQNQVVQDASSAIKSYQFRSVRRSLLLQAFSLAPSVWISLNQRYPRDQATCKDKGWPKDLLAGQQAGWLAGWLAGWPAWTVYE